MSRKTRATAQRKHPSAFTPRDLVELWSRLDGIGKEAVVTGALGLLQTRETSSEEIEVTYEVFGQSSRWPTPKWRRRRDGSFDANINDVAGLEQLLRSVAADPFLADEPVLWRVPISNGHFAIGGRERRIVLVGLASETHWDGLRGSLRAHLQKVTRTPGAEIASWADELAEPGWSATERWLSDGTGT